MCLVSVCPKGTSKYSKEVSEFIKVGVASNRDGSGFMYKRDGDTFIHVKKGFKTANGLLAAIKEANLTDNDELVIHHRIGTSGSKLAVNNHPFVVSKIHDEIINTNCKVDKPCLVHNGVFWGLDKYEEKNKDFSDTYAFVRYIMANSIEFLTSDKELFEEVYSKILGYNKICLLMPDQDLIMLGNFVEENGYYHSHGGFKDYSHRDIGGRSYNTKVNSNFHSAGSNNTGTCQLKLPIVITGKSKEPVVITGELLDINSFNAKHFLFVPKDERDNDIMQFETYDDDSITNILTTRMQNKTSYCSLGVSNTTLRTKYTYHPLPVYAKFYSEYLEVLTRLTPSKSLFKEIYKTLTQKSIKDKHLAHPIKIKQVVVSKFTLLNYYFSLIDAYMAEDSFYANYKVSDLVYSWTPLNEEKSVNERECIIMD